MTTETPTEYEQAQELLKRVFALACRRYKLDAQEATALAQSLSASDVPPPLPPLPNAAPELWSDRDPGRRENPVQFTRRVYAPWLGRGLTRRELRELDFTLMRAIGCWEVRHPSDRMQDLPTLAKSVDALIDDLLLLFPLSELRSLSGGIERRIQKGRLTLD